MTNKRKRLCSIVLLLAVAISLCLAPSCGGTDDDAPDSQNVPAAETSSDTGTEILYTADYLPEKDFGGYSFRVLSCAYPNGFSIVTLADAEEQTGEILNDAIYTRNLKIEEKYNINFKAEYAPFYYDMTSQFRQSVLSASDDYDLNMLICRDAFSLAQEKMMVALDRLPYVDISKPWYVHTINDELSIGGKLYFAYSDDAINLFEWTVLVLFNKAYAQNYQLPDFYSLVREGNWTIDALFSSAREVISDLNGDGQYDDRDRLGIISQNDFYYPSFWIGANLKTVQKDSDDIPRLAVLGNERFFTLLTNVVNFTEEPGMYFDTFDDRAYTMALGQGDEVRISGHKLFSQGLSLFEVTNVGSLQSIRNMEDDFGLLPFPKYDESQIDYASRTIDGWLYCVPVTNSDLERTSIIMESMAVEAKNTIVPAYYNVALHDKYTRDPESKEMLDLVYNTRTFDMGDVFWIDAVRSVYTKVMREGKTEFASQTEKNATIMTKTIQKAVDAFLSE